MGSVGKSSTRKQSSFLRDVLNTVNNLSERTIFEAIGDVFDLEQKIMDTINPKFHDGRKWQENCALCTTALEMQARGEDVQAAARDSTWRGVPDYLQMDLTDPDSYVVGTTVGRNYEYMTEWDHMKNAGPRQNTMRSIRNNPNKFATRSTGAYDSLTKYMNKWGPNSRAELCVWWKSSNSRHSVFVVNTSKGPVVIDGQDGVPYYDKETINGLFARTKITKTLLYRMDNRKVKESFSNDRDKMVIRRKK